MRERPPGEGGIGADARQADPEGGRLGNNAKPFPKARLRRARAPRLAPCSPEQISEALATKRAPDLSRQLLGYFQSGKSRKIDRSRLEGVDVLPDNVAFYSI
jgi:hypothetical protein